MTTMMDDSTSGPTDPPPGDQPNAGGPPPADPPFPGGPGGSSVPGFPAATQRLRRSREDRVASGLAGGLGRYFGIDPVIFRVLFAVLALFGGSGIALYLLGWLAVPDDGATNAPVDRAIAELRRRHVPFWLVVGAGLLLGWALFFSWWAPHTLIPAVIVAVALVVLLARRRPPVAPTDPAVGSAAPGVWSSSAPPSAGPWPAAGPTGADYAPTAAGSSATAVAPAASQLRTWFDDSRAAARIRRHRAAPVRLAVLAAVVVAVAVLAVVDAVSGIPFAAYFWTVGAIVLTGLVVGLLARRTPWSTAALLLPVAFGLAVFASSPIQAHDGWGDRSARPANATEMRDQYKLAFGRDTIDLSQVTTITGSRTVKIIHGAGQVRLIVPSSLPVRIDADIHNGAIMLNGHDENGGMNYNRSFATPGAANATDVVRIHVQLAAGELEITYV
ncbi:MAG: PspC domain-containing protein [bacterium]